MPAAQTIELKQQRLGAFVFRRKPTPSRKAGAAATSRRPSAAPRRSVSRRCEGACSTSRPEIEHGDLLAPVAGPFARSWLISSRGAFAAFAQRVR